MKDRPIGLLDSGVGGLTVLKAVKDRLPKESFVYIGDTKRCPYGNRSVEEIITYTLELVQFLVDQQVKMIIIACNTATAHALEIIQHKLTIPVIGVVEPGSIAAAAATDSKVVGVLATVSTVESGFYEKSILNQDASIRVKSFACPEFVEIVENNAYESDRANKIVQKKLETFKTPKMDTVILGCTHFPLLAPSIQNVLGDDVSLIDSGVLTSFRVERELEKQEMNTSNERNGSLKLFTTGPEKMFHTIAQDWLQTNTFTLQNVSLERLKLTHD